MADARVRIGGITPSSVADLEGLRARYRGAAPYPHLVIDDFLDEHLFERLVAEFPPTETAEAVDMFGRASRKFAASNVRDLGPAYRELDELVASELLDLAGRITGIEGLEYDPSYFGGGTHENLDGQGLHPHVDFNHHPVDRRHRRVNVILYLNPEWHEDWGGILELQADARDRSDEPRARVVPIANRCVLFETTDTSWHGHTPVAAPPDRPGLTRRSFAVYYYTAEHPAHDAAGHHSTVFAPRRPRAELDPETRELLEDYERLLAHHQATEQHLSDLLEEHQQVIARLRERVARFEVAATVPTSGPVRLIDGAATNGTAPVSLRAGFRCELAVERLAVSGQRLPGEDGDAEVALLAEDGSVVVEPVPDGPFTVELEGPFAAGTTFELRIAPSGSPADDPSRPFLRLTEIVAIAADG